MLSIREQPSFTIITASGRLTEEDYDAFVPAFERLARERGRVAMLVDITDLEGWDIAALWRDLKFAVRHRDSFGPMAMVGDARWKEWAAEFSKPFLGSPVQYFHPGEAKDAERWLLEYA